MTIAETVNAEVADIVRAAMKPPVKRGRPPESKRICQYAGIYCADCPDAPTLPCVQAGGFHDCEGCTLSACACMIGWTKERRADHDRWQKARRHAEAVRRKRRKLYYHIRRRLNGEDRHKYKLGRVCAYEDCDAEIMDVNKSGFCRRHSPRKKAGQAPKQAQSHPWRQGI